MCLLLLIGVGQQGAGDGRALVDRSSSSGRVEHGVDVGRLVHGPVQQAEHRHERREQEGVLPAQVAAVDGDELPHDQRAQEAGDRAQHVRHRVVVAGEALQGRERGGARKAKEK